MEAEGRLFGGRRPTPGGLGAKLRDKGFLWVVSCPREKKHVFLIFRICYMGFWVQEGLEMVRGWIPLHLDKVSAQMDHSGSIRGPFLISNFLEIHTGSHFGPNRP